MVELTDLAATPVAIFTPSTISSTGTTNLPDGIVHIFRERGAALSSNLQTSSASKAPQAEVGTSNLSFQAKEQTNENSEQDVTTVAVLAVPAWMTPSDFLAFVAPAAEGMQHLRLIRDVSPNRTMVIMQFREPSSAAEFIEEYNGRQFNSVEVRNSSSVILGKLS